MVYVKIEKHRLKELMHAENELGLLEAGGVDNWDWYSESLYSRDLEYDLHTLNEASDVIVDEMEEIE